MPRAEEMLIWAGLTVPKQARLPGDADIETTCPTCRQPQTLAEADFDDTGDESIYTCKEGCGPILIIGIPGRRSWPGRGYRLGNFVLRNPSDLFLHMIDQEGNRARTPILMPASPAALANESERP